ncbi:MAG: Gfo/Idh/MocA family oxidoreductase [bacterium]
MSSEKCRVAVIGVGYLGRFHARKYAGLKEASLIYCVDTDQARASEVAQEINARPESDYRRVLSEVDAVSIAVPTPLHYRVARDCLEAGLDILLEKPVTQTLEEADLLIGLAAKKKRIFMAGHLERFNPPLRKLEDTLVKPAFIQAERLGPFRERAANIDVVLDLMIHDVDIVLGFVDANLKRISAIGVPVLSDKVDLANARLEFENGAVANLTASRVSLGEATRKIRIFQHSSYTSIDTQAQKMAVFTLGEGSAEDPMSRIRVEQIELDRQDALEQEIKEFLSCVRDRREPKVSGAQGRRALEVSLQILECIESTPRAEELD